MGGDAKDMGEEDGEEEGEGDNTSARRDLP